MEQLTAFAAREGGARRIAIRFVNVLGSAGSASELFLTQARAGVPLTVTDSGMIRYWITMAHSATLAAHAVLLAEDGTTLAVPAEPATLTVGQLANAIWSAAGRTGEPEFDLIGIRAGETVNEELIGPGEQIGPETHQGIAPIEAEVPTAGPAWVAERLPQENAEAARSVWLEAMRRPEFFTPRQTGARRAGSGP
jgi:FlaA1/EpsC-like NDP-sugar epimerase